MKQVNKKPGKQEPRWQTKISGGNFVDKFHAYRNLHAHALFSSLGRLVASRFSSAMTITVLAIAISLASGFYILVANLQQLAGNLEASNQISLFLKDEISEARANKFANTIRQNPDIQDVKVITKEQALAEFQTYSGFGDAVKALEKNPLPVVIQVLPKNSLKNELVLETLLDDFKRSTEVDFAQMDMQWVKRLQSIMDVARCGVTILSLLLGAGVLFITANTIRLELHNRRDEVVIAKLVGATNSFIHRPFLYGGFWIGFFSGVAAWFIVTTIMLILKQPIERLSGLYDDGFHVLFLGFTETLALLVISSVLGVVGSWIVLHFQLRQLKPE
ncbi:permease-like cell division protein FtsX [Methylobacter sp. Wu8]|uniref:Cell division protein FtsX n=1 Tax=Methylobacter tundripaludum TaxID=173365 RepID=A0A2S6GP24_9GAMM|nr:permease-like cell division protein FtsX [Methylobacter tundripaludum]MCF7964506.1 permease-like cell division protein FtsX [Methylobacter tundripaludum]MCK9637664.1 permease-like cell division protein FtsX [Methylobacter tundripaludum]PPK66988.1 cell division protein FtsX [Methylobacter tundripaludum]